MPPVTDEDYMRRALELAARAEQESEVPVGAVVVGGGGAILVTILWTFLFPELRKARTFDAAPHA